MKQTRRRSDVRSDAHGGAAQQMPINVPTHNQQIANLLAQPSVPASRGIPAVTSQTPQGVAFRNTNVPNNRTPALSAQQQTHNFLQQIPARGVSTVNAAGATRKGSAPGRVPLANFRGPTQQQQRFAPTVE
jgi:hypothetical protein